MIKISFKLFDEDGNGAIETKNKNGKNELESIWNSQKNITNNDNNENNIELENFINYNSKKTKDSSNNKSNLTYESITTDNQGNEVVSTYSTNNKLLKKSTTFPNGIVQKDYYSGNSSFVTKTEEYNKKNKLIKSTTFYDGTENIKKVINYDFITNLPSKEFYYNNDENNSISKKKTYKVATDEVEKWRDGEIVKKIIYTKDGMQQKVTEKITDSNTFQSVQYRDDDSIYSTGEYKDKNANDVIQETKLYPTGSIKSKSYTNNENFITNRYNKEGNISIIEISDNNDHTKLLKRTIYNKDGSVYMETTYSKQDGKILNFIKNENKSRVGIEDFDESQLNGDIDTSYKQDLSGTCYVVSTIQSLLLTDKGKELINNSVDYNNKKEEGTVTLKGVNKKYNGTFRFWRS